MAALTASRARRASRAISGRNSVSWVISLLAVRKPASSAIASKVFEATAAIERWYRREARRRIGEVVRQEAERLGFEFRSVAIRDPRTRWGSCSRRGNLSFSWRLLLAPADVLHYVVVHELCHLREPSHQKAFWRLLGSVRPGWQHEVRWLREHGQELHDYRPEVPVES